MQKLRKKALLNNAFVALAMLALVVLGACSGSRQAVEERKIPNRKTGEILDSMRSNELACDWISVKYDVEFKGPKLSDSFKMYLRMKRDSAIWISATYYAVEVGRFLFTPDSVKILNRRSNQYYVGNYEYLTKQFGVETNYEMLESLILANSMALESSEGEKVRSSKDEGMYLLSFLRKGQLRRVKRNGDANSALNLVVSLWVEPDHFRLGKMNVSDFEAGREMTAVYSDFEPECNSFFPQHVSYDIQNGNEQLEVKTSVLKFTSGKAVSLSFTIPEKYEPLVP